MILIPLSAACVFNVLILNSNSDGNQRYRGQFTLSAVGILPGLHSGDQGVLGGSTGVFTTWQQDGHCQGMGESSLNHVTRRLQLHDG